jgi:hypothetical protein
MWWRLKRVIAPSSESSAIGSAVASPTSKLTFSTPAAAASARAFSTIVGVRSIPTTEPIRGAIARAISPGPQAVSTQRASGSSGTRSTSTPSVWAMFIAGLRAKESAWWANSSRSASEWASVLTGPS